jgi:hypothetical protein
MNTKTEWILNIGGDNGLKIYGIKPPHLLRRWITSIITCGAVRFYRGPSLSAGFVYAKDDPNIADLE